MSVKLGNTNIAGTQVLYSTTGSNTDGAMTQAATTDELNLKSNDIDVVHKTGDESVSDVKTFTHNIISNTDGWNIISHHNNITLGNIPASNIWTGIQCQDSSNTEFGVLGVSYRTNGEMWSQIMATLGSTQSAIRAIVNANNVAYTYAPASDVSNSIVTTVNKSKKANGYFKLGNGLIIQWGHVVAASGEIKTVTFPTAFSNTNYYVHSNTNRSGSTGSGWGYVTSKTTTDCKLTTSSDACDWLAIGY